MALGLFEHRPFAMGGLVAFIYGMGLFGSTYLVPVFMQEALHLPPSQAGAVLLPAGLVLAVTIPLAGRLADRMPVHLVVTDGLLLLALSFALMITVGVATALWLIALWAVIGRVGLGFVLPSLNLGSMRGLPNRSISHGSSTINFLRQLGGAVGISLVGNVLEWRLQAAPGGAAGRLPRNLRADRRDHRLRHGRGVDDEPPAGPPGASRREAAERSRAGPAMNLGIDALPARCDVLVVGAGPAGSAAAQTLARAGLDVVLVDQQAFPRDKVCGDGLIPDAHNALRRLGVLDEVMALAQRRPATSPASGRAAAASTCPARSRCCRAKRLDEIICRAAVAAGARMFAPVRFVARARGSGRWRPRRRRPLAARRRGRERDPLPLGHPRDRRAAAGDDRRRPVRAAHAERHRLARLRGERGDDGAHHQPRGRLAQAPRARLRLDLSVRRRRLQHRRRRRHSHREGKDGKHAMHDVNLREVFAAFKALYAPARELVEGGPLAEPAS